VKTKYSINRLIRSLKSIAEKHRQINSFGIGSLYDVTFRKLLYGGMPDKSTITSQPTYPLMWFNVVDSSIQGRAMYFSFQVILADLVTDGEKNDFEIYSDLQLVAQDVVGLLSKESADEKEFKLDESVTMTPFADRFEDSLNGWVLNMRIKIAYGYENSCSIPTVDELGIEEVIGGIDEVRNAEATKPQTVVAGGVDIVQYENEIFEQNKINSI
jgi:hypothetical protein